LVYIIGISPRLLDQSLLESQDFLGKYGNIRKLVINKANPFNSPEGVSYSCYVNFSNEIEAAKCIKATDGFKFDGRTLKATFGTTKYCNNFLKGKKCEKADCLYLHEKASKLDSLKYEEIKHNSHIQPHNSIYSRLKVVISSQEENKFPDARLPRPRYFSEDIYLPRVKPRLYSMDTSIKSRFWFVEEGEPLCQEPLIEVITQVSPLQEVVEMNVSEALQILNDNWYSDVLKVQASNEGFLAGGSVLISAI